VAVHSGFGPFRRSRASEGWGRPATDEPTQSVAVLEEDRRRARAGQEAQRADGRRPQVIKKLGRRELEKSRNFARHCHQQAGNGAFSRWACGAGRRRRTRPRDEEG